MTINSLKDVYLDQLQDLYSADMQALKATEQLKGAATDADLVRALQSGVHGISRGIESLAKLCSDHDIDPTAKHCRGMEGLAKEARAHAVEEDFGDDDARDAMIITQYQRMAHYGIAGYGCLVAFANRLGLDGDAAVLRECLDSTYDGDHHMSALAMGGINKAAISETATGKTGAE